MRRQDSVTAAINEPEHVVVRDFLAETDAARAENTAFVIQCDARADLHSLWFFYFVLQKARLRIAVIDAEFLQAAFARLIADWAVQRVIDQEKFHYALPTFLHQKRVRANGHSFRDILRAANLRTRHPVDDRLAIRVELRFAIGAEPRESHFDETHPAITGRGKLLVITIPGHENADLLARLNHARAFWKLMPDPIYLDIQ